MRVNHHRESRVLFSAEKEAFLQILLFFCRRVLYHKQKVQVPYARGKEQVSFQTLKTTIQVDIGILHLRIMMPLSVV